MERLGAGEEVVRGLGGGGVPTQSIRTAMRGRIEFSWCRRSDWRIVLCYWACHQDYRSSLNPASTAGRLGAFATNQPVRYIHCAIRVSLG